MSEKIIHSSDSSFEQDVIKSAQPVLVDFWAPWCGPCQIIGPVIDEVASEYLDKLRVVKINVDENPVTPQTYGIMAIPTLILFKDGRPLEKAVGVLSKSKLIDLINKHI